jgi:hypothetical protein
MGGLDPAESSVRATDCTLSQHSPAAAKIALFRSLFRGREDVYPRRFESRKSGKSFLAVDFDKAGWEADAVAFSQTGYSCCTPFRRSRSAELRHRRRISS